MENEKIFYVNNCPEIYEDIKHLQERRGNTVGDAYIDIEKMKIR